MHIDLSGRTALVTGSTQGIGYAIALGLARAGARVAVNGRGTERVVAAVGRVRADSGNDDVVAAVGDLATEEGAAAVLEAVPTVDRVRDHTQTGPGGALAARTRYRSASVSAASARRHPSRGTPACTVRSYLNQHRMHPARTCGP